MGAYTLDMLRWSGSISAPGSASPARDRHRPDTHQQAEKKGWKRAPSATTQSVHEPHLALTVIVPRNEEYAVLKAFAELEHTPGVPGLDLPGLDIVSQAKGFGG
jgi:hypothetical protein